MSRAGSTILLAALAAGILAPVAVKAERFGPVGTRVYAPNLSCAAVQGAVARSGVAIVASSPTAYEKVYASAGECRNEVTSAPAYTPSADTPYCFAGYRCRDRNDVIPTR